MTALIVRTEPGAGAFVRRLAAQGIPAIACPVTAIHPLDTPLAVPPTAQAVLFTSVNAVHAYAARGARTDLPAWAVGDRTAGAAGAAGFASVRSAGSDVRGLAALIARECRPDRGELVYPAARDVAGNLRQALEAGGFAVVQAAIYEARGAAELPESAGRALRTHTAVAAALFSVRNAREFARLVDGAGLRGALSGMYACCIGEAVAAAFAASGPWPAGCRTPVAASPDADAMAALLATLPGARRPADAAGRGGRTRRP